MESARVRPSRGPEGVWHAVTMLRPGGIGAAGQPDRPAPAHADDSRSARPMFLWLHPPRREPAEDPEVGGAVLT